MAKKIQLTHKSAVGIRINNVCLKLTLFLADPMKVFIALSLSFGVLMMIVMPIFMVPDEAVHFDRSYLVGEGNLVGKNINGKIGSLGPVIPPQVTRKDGSTIIVPVNQYFKKVKTPEVFNNFPTTATASPLTYVPQAIGVDIGRIVNGSLGSMVLFGRLFNLITYIVLIALAIKIARMGKWVYAVIGLFPVAIQQAASLSYDSMTIGLAFLSIAFIHNLFIQEETIKKPQIIITCLLAAALMLSKQNNVLLLIPLLFLPINKFGSVIRKLSFLALSYGSAVVSAITWFLYIHISYKGLSPIVETGSQNVVPSAQLSLILHNPILFSKVLFRTYIYEGRGAPLSSFFIESMHSVFSWISYKEPLEFVLIGYALLLVVFLYKEQASRKEKNFKLINVAVSSLLAYLVSLVAIAMTLYLFWSPVGSAQVGGIQGRYFIPLIPLLIPFFRIMTKWFSFEISKPHYLGSLVLLISSLNLTVMLLLTYKWFY